MTTMEQNQTAAESRYDELRDEARRLIKSISESVEAHGDTGIHWGHVGDMGHLTVELTELCRFIGGLAATVKR